MSFCTNCSHPLDAADKFCKNCGAAVAAASVPEAPVIVEPYSAPAPSTKSKLLGFVGMGLAIGGLVFAVLGLLYTFIGMVSDGVLAFAFSVSFGLFSLPVSIVGGVLCNQSMAMGNHATPCSVGAKLRVAGIIVSAGMLFFGLIGLMV